jgi:hypothetical protein
LLKISTRHPAPKLPNLTTGDNKLMTSDSVGKALIIPNCLLVCSPWSCILSPAALLPTVKARQFTPPVIHIPWTLTSHSGIWHKYIALWTSTRLALRGRVLGLMRALLFCYLILVFPCEVSWVLVPGQVLEPREWV